MNAAPSREFETPPLDIETVARDNTFWIHVRGEADRQNHEQLRAELARVRLEGVETVHLALADLTFCDLHAFRTLYAFAQQVRAAGPELSAHGARPMLRRMAELLGVADELGLG